MFVRCRPLIQSMIFVVLYAVIETPPVFAGGTIEFHPIDSKILAAHLELSVYLPPGYATSQKSYPVFYVFHGDPGTNQRFFGGTGPSGTINVGLMADSLIAQGQMQPMIIVGPTISGPLGPSGDGKRYADYMLQEIIPYVDQHFRTLSARENRGVLGYSDGGSRAVQLVFLRPELFGALGIYAGTLGYGAGIFRFENVTRGYDSGRYPLRFWVGHGRKDKDTSFRVSESFVDNLKMRKWEYLFYADDGDHFGIGLALKMALPYFAKVLNGDQAPFAVVPGSEAAPLQIQLQETTAPQQNTGKLWDFGDGQTSAEQRPVHTYAKPGQYVLAFTRQGPQIVSAASRAIVVGPSSFSQLAIRLFYAGSDAALSNKSLSLQVGHAVPLVVERLTPKNTPTLVSPTWTTTGDIGTITPGGMFTAGRKAGNTGRIIARAGTISDTLQVRLTADRPVRMTITPSMATVSPGQEVSFEVTAADSFGNSVRIQGLLWYTVGGIGTIDKRRGKFTAGTKGGTGYVIAYADSIFGDTGATLLSGSAKVVVESVTPTAYTLAQNYPNPFNPSTTIRFELPEVRDLHLAVYDLSGHVVRTLGRGYYPPGSHVVVWDGRDEESRLVASGVYLYRLEALDRGFVETRRMLLIK